MTTPRLTDMIAAGGRAIGRYTGTLLSVFVVQSLVAVVVMFAIAFVLARVFAMLPMWDDAVDGDLLSLIVAVVRSPQVFEACVGIGVGALALWQLASWFVVGGVLGVLAQRPEGRGETARCFGASGAQTYLAFVRLLLCSIPGYLLVLFVFVTCAQVAAPRITHALSVAELVAPLALALGPALLLLHVLWTISDYARIDLVLHHDTHDPGALASYMRAMAFVMRHPVTLVHGLVGWLAFALITLGYSYLAHGHPMFGAEGAITLFVIRQGVALARTAARFGVLGGQLELGAARPPPPRRIETSLEGALG